MDQTTAIGTIGCSRAGAGQDHSRRKITRTDLSHQDLTGSRFAHARFSNVLMQFADARDCDFHGARFADCDFGSTLFRGADFSRCVFERCDFRGTDLLDARFDGARFIDCDLTDLVSAKLDGARIGGGCRTISRDWWSDNGSRVAATSLAWLVLQISALIAMGIALLDGKGTIVAAGAGMTFVLMLSTLARALDLALDTRLLPFHADCLAGRTVRFRRARELLLQSLGFAALWLWLAVFTI